MRLLVSVHDVTPFHGRRLARIETLLRRIGVSDVAYLVVPRYHGGWPIEEDRAFVDWLASARPWASEWILHGFTHSEPSASGCRRSNGALWVHHRLLRRLLTDGEAECLTLNTLALGSRLAEARRAFISAVGHPPRGFVAPAWLFDDRLIPILQRLRFDYTEDQYGLIGIGTGCRVPSPVITWATRTPFRRWGSCVLAPALRRVWRSAPLLRIAIHPYDMESADVVRSIERTLADALAARTNVSYASLLACPRAEQARDHSSDGREPHS